MTDRLELMSTIQCCGGLEEDQIDVYVEQGSTGKDVCTLRFLNGTMEHSISFLNSIALDELAYFLTTAAQKLRYCTK